MNENLNKSEESDSSKSNGKNLKDALTVLPNNIVVEYLRHGQILCAFDPKDGHAIALTFVPYPSPQTTKSNLTEEMKMSEQQETTGWQEFAKELGDRLLTGYPCIVVISNELPPAWNVSIIAAATRFFYQNPDGSPQGDPFTDTETNINIGSGGSVALRSDFPDRCVRRADTVIWVKAGNEPPKTFGASEDVGVGQCLRSKQYRLAPTKVLSHEKSRGADSSVLFKLVSED